jgi:penicillin-insensitive murein DD-endopeptidase
VPADVPLGRRFVPADVPLGLRFVPADVPLGLRFVPADVPLGLRFVPADVPLGRRFVPADVPLGRRFLAGPPELDATLDFVLVHRLAVLVAVAAVPLAVLAAPAAADPAAPTARSLSCGATNRGALAGARALPDSGQGYVAPEPWRSRRLRYATDELVGLIERAAAQVAREHAGAVLGVADLSAERGGAVARHASHQSGRDADLIYYAIDRAGDPFHPDHHMAFYGADGRATSAESPEPASAIGERFFDLPRNWALVAALAADPDVRVTRIFVSRRVREWLLAYARAAEVPADILSRAESVLYTARDAGTHQDHMHVRIACSAEDVAHGRCADESAAPPRRRRGRRHRNRPRRWYVQIRCGDTEVMASSPPTGSGSQRGL